MTENRKIHAGDALPDLELWTDIQRGWIVPVGGSTPDRQKVGCNPQSEKRPTQIPAQERRGALRQIKIL